MTAEYRLTETAEGDLEEILRFVAERAAAICSTVAAMRASEGVARQG